MCVRESSVHVPKLKTIFFFTIPKVYCWYNIADISVYFFVKVAFYIHCMYSSEEKLLLKVQYFDLAKVWKKTKESKVQKKNVFDWFCVLWCRGDGGKE